MLISALFAQSDCNKENWQEYYNSDGMGRVAQRDMSDCQLQGAMLQGARLMGADLTGADLTGANFTQSRLMGADLIGANFTGANFTGAKLIGIISGDIRGVPDNLPEDWSLVDGTLIK